MPKSADAIASGGLRVDALVGERGGRRLFGPRDLAVAPGAALFVVGPNGCGKTTLLRALAGLTEAQCGSAAWDGEPGELRSVAWRRRICFAGHRPGHKDDLSAAENLALALALDNQVTSAASCTQALARVGLAQRAVLAVKRLSQGQRQRLTLARLLLSQRPLWLLDEPTAALDTDARALLGGILAEHFATGGVAVIATHDRIDLAAGASAELRLGPA